jgi:hypothetical protein
MRNSSTQPDGRRVREVSKQSASHRAITSHTARTSQVPEFVWEREWKWVTLTLSMDSAAAFQDSGSPLLLELRLLYTCPLWWSCQQSVLKRYLESLLCIFSDILTSACHFFGRKSENSQTCPIISAMISPMLIRRCTFFGLARRCQDQLSTRQHWHLAPQRKV